MGTLIDQHPYDFPYLIHIPHRSDGDEPETEVKEKTIIIHIPHRSDGDLFFARLYSITRINSHSTQVRWGPKGLSYY